MIIRASATLRIWSDSLAPEDISRSRRTIDLILDLDPTDSD